MTCCFPRFGLIAHCLGDDAAAAAAAAADKPCAAGILETAHTTLPEQASNIPDAPTRRMVRERVPHHRELRAAWTKAQDRGG